MSSNLPAYSTAATAQYIQVVGDSSQAATKLMKREGVRSVPAFHFWKDGKKVDTVSGANSEALENGVKDYA
jgi:thioredoxin 1